MVLKAILTGTTQSKDELVGAAEGSRATASKLCEEVKQGAASLTSDKKEAQVGR